MQHYPIDSMTPGDSVVLLVTAQNPYRDQWKPRTPVTVERTAAGFLFRSPYGVTAADIADSPHDNPGHRGLCAHMQKLTGTPYPFESITRRDLVRKVYRGLRRQLARLQDTRPERGAAACLKLAREWIDAGRKDYPGRYGPASIWRGLGGSDGCAFKAYGEPRCRWIENPESKGLRFVGLAGDISRSLPTGYFLDDFQDETVRGVVYQLPTRGGVSRFLAGYADPFNADKNGRGPACLSLQIFEADPAGDYWDTSAESSEGARDAARLADSMADDMADAERAYRESYHAGQEAREAAGEMLAAGRDVLALCRSIRGLWKVRHGLPVLPGPDARAVIRGQIAAFRGARGNYEEARDNWREALETGHGWRCEDCSAWREGYAEGV